MSFMTPRVVVKVSKMLDMLQVRVQRTRTRARRRVGVRSSNKHFRDFGHGLGDACPTNSASGYAEYGSSYGSAEEGFQIDYLVPDSDWSRPSTNEDLFENSYKGSSGGPDMILNMCCGCIENLELLLDESLGVTCSS